MKIAELHYKVTAKVNGRVFLTCSFGGIGLAQHWFNQWQTSYKNWTGHYCIELHHDNKVIDTFEYEGSGRYEIVPDAIKVHRRKPFVPKVFPDFERPHYNCIVGQGRLSEKEIYKDEKTPAKKTDKTNTKTNTTTKTPMRTTNNTTRKTVKPTKKSTKK